MTTDLGLIEIIVGADAMQARVRINPHGDVDDQVESRLISHLTAQSIEVTDETRDRVRLLSERLHKQEFPEEDIVLAEGTPPVPGEDGRIDWEPEHDPTHRAVPPAAEGDHGPTDAVDHYARTSIVSVSEGETVCTVIEPTPGEPGRDVYGRQVPPRKGHKAPVAFDDTIVPADDEENPGRMVARISGRLNLIGGKAHISPLLVIRRDVDFQTGNIKFDGDVVVRGNVLDLFQVQATRDLVVHGIIEAAKITCDGSLTAAGGIAGKEKAAITVGGCVRARFIDNATVTAGGNIIVQNEMVNSTVVTEHALETRGAITACRVEACAGIKAGIVGSASGTRTSLMVGSTAEIYRQLARLEREQGVIEARIDQQRSSLEPMLQRQKQLPQMQKNMAMKLLTSIKEDMTRLSAIEALRDKLRLAVESNRDASIEVQRIIHEGTTVQIGKAVATICDSLRGPVKLTARKVEGVDRIAAATDEGRGILLEPCKQ